MLAYWNGKILEDSEIHISPFDLSVLRGYGVFDVMRTEKGRVFNIEKHWERFCNSAQLLHLTIPITYEQFKEITSELISENQNISQSEFNIRAVLTGGVSTDSFHPVPGAENFFLLFTPFVPLEESIYTQGVKIISIEHKRELAQAKITNYIQAIEYSGLKMDQEAFEILFVKEGLVYEASTSNFFIIKNDTLITPKEGVLLGTTRNLTLQLAKKLGLKVEERALRIEELASSDEAFLTAVNKYIVPVVTIDSISVGTGTPGKLTLKLLESMREYIESEEGRLTV